MHASPTLLHLPCRPRRGSVLVELAFVLPVFLLIATGIVEFGRAMMVGQVLSDGAREGARRAVQAGATHASVEQDLKDLLTRSLQVPSDEIDVAIVVQPAGGKPDSGNSLAAAQPKDLIDVRIRVGFDQVACVAGGFLSGTNLEGHCVVRRQ